MRFILTDSSDSAVAALAERLVSELSSGKNVLWLTSGGTNVSASVKVMDLMPDEITSNLSVMPIDERFGSPGHADSNWGQLINANFQSKQAHLIPVLEGGLDFAQNTAHYNELAQKAFESSDVVIAQLGMGPDGHIAGILPNSPACNENTALVTSYEAAPLKRMTLTFQGIKKINAAYVFVFGDNKLEALNRLKSESLPLEEQPAQILKSLPESYIYNDQIGENS